MSEYLPKIHSEIVSVMDQIKTVCERNDITYYITAGTLLGAVRHKGFIPWDDDLDIVMPRADFDKFIEICDREMPEEYRLVWTTTDKRYWYPFAKVQKTSTLFVESAYATSKSQYGIYVDIFPLDEVEGYSETVEKKKKRVARFNSLMRENVLHSNGISKKKIVSHLLPNWIWNKMQSNVMRSNNEKNGEYFVNYGSYYSVKKQVMPKKWFGVGKEIEFEGRLFTAPTEYIRVLESIYGTDYMQLPPPDKRMTHYPSKVIFSDGETMDFVVDPAQRKSYKG